MFSRRKDDYKILFYIGKTFKDIRKIFVVEAIFAAISAVIAALICSPIGAVAFDVVVALYELPVEFNIRAFNFKSLGVGCIIGVIGAVLTVWLGYLTTRKEIKRYGGNS